MLGNGQNASPVPPQAVRYRQQKWSAAGDQHSLPGNRPAVLYQVVQSSRSNNSGQGPAGEREKQLARPGCQNEPVPSKLAGRIVPFGQQQPGFGLSKHRRFRQQHSARTTESGKPLARARVAVFRVVLIAAPDLTPEPGRFVSQRDAPTALGRDGCRRQPGRARTDHDDIEGESAISHRSTLPFPPCTNACSFGEAFAHQWQPCIPCRFPFRTTVRGAGRPVNDETC